MAARRSSRSMLTHLGVAAALLAACNDSDADKPAAKPAEGTVPVEPLKATATVSFNGKQRRDQPTGTPRPQPKLTVTLDGAPVAMTTALAWKDRDGLIRVTASSVPVGCDEVTGTGRWMHDGEVSFARGAFLSARMMEQCS